MTQRDRVLQALRAVGPRGICQTDFTQWPTVDNGPPLLRLAARIEELRSEGHTITGAGLRHKCKVYVLHEPVREIAAAAPNSLFDPPPAPPRNALNDDWDAA